LGWVGVGVWCGLGVCGGCVGGCGIGGGVCHFLAWSHMLVYVFFLVSSCVVCARAVGEGEG